MPEISLIDSLYVSEDPAETTFKYDNQLPSLPVPTLQDTTRKLLETIKPLAADENAYKETERKALDFLKDPNVSELQDLLKKRASSTKNWLEDWWLEYAYLRSRKPLIPFSNMAAPLPIMDFWPIIKPNSPEYPQVRCKRAALSTYFQLCFWRMLRDEKMRPMIHKGVPWSMSQFKFLFNTVRTPGDQKDKITTWFRTTKEGPPESLEVIVLHKGYIFAIQPVTMITPTQMSVLSAPQIERQLRHIEDWCKSRPLGPGVGTLTTCDRSDWAEAREKIGDICERNLELLDRIDRALSVLVLEDDEPNSENEILNLSMCGDPRNRWADKSITSIAFKNGTFGANADHSPYDGFCTAIMTHYLITSVKECDGLWIDSLKTAGNSTWAVYREPELLDFQLNAQISQLIDETRLQFSNICDTIDILHNTFRQYGKAILKEHRFHPEAFVQCAIHATYYKLHKEMASAYVTASTRRFHNGRTETCRSCFPEMKDFAAHLADFRTSRARETYELLKNSVNKFQKTMDEASNGHGCDRHLMGLYLTALLEGKKIPELFDDDLVMKTSNYILSTSCAGYWNVCGGVPPLVEDGYGCFYGIEDDAITFCCTAYRPSTKTDIRKFYSLLEETLVEMHRILLASKL